MLKKVPELQCTPEVFRECNDVERKIPYLEPAEDCVEITFDECQEVTILAIMRSHSSYLSLQIIERVPVELCKRKRVNEDSITLSKGKVERKEGEKRRTPAFRRAVNQSRELFILPSVSYLADVLLSFAYFRGKEIFYSDRLRFKTSQTYSERSINPCD